ncbi:hypothetical protein [Acetobacter pasteurianus]|uniref:Uncharacterized protein n=1 Tax=Acetobacter pasteurianus subsp. pasteurianus TaxID=481145 RepID=A0A1Y0Y8F0_ACEPA|nr:hypothetical protein [Acetobacter pasteurianus]ARW48717.1 hypothetical protein S1001342_02418 [Acetobacter pasteurianus subsp. pasteurianus]
MSEKISLHARVSVIETLLQDRLKKQFGSSREGLETNLSVFLKPLLDNGTEEEKEAAKAFISATLAF